MKQGLLAAGCCSPAPLPPRRWNGEAMGMLVSATGSTFLRDSRRSQKLKTVTGTSTSPDGITELRIWGSHITEGDFLSEVSWRIDKDKAEGWDIAYERKTRQWASWSGRRSARVMYGRAIPLCRDQAAYFRIEYESSDVELYSRVVERLVNSLRSDGGCR